MKKMEAWRGEWKASLGDETKVNASFSLKEKDLIIGTTLNKK